MIIVTRLIKWVADVAYWRAWDRALNRCRRDPFNDKIYDKRYAILTVRKFEAINRCAFNPFDAYHCDLIAGMAWGTAIFADLRAMGSLRG